MSALGSEPYERTTPHLTRLSDVGLEPLMVRCVLCGQIRPAKLQFMCFEIAADICRPKVREIDRIRKRSFF